MNFGFQEHQQLHATPPVLKHLTSAAKSCLWCRVFISLDGYHNEGNVTQAIAPSPFPTLMFFFILLFILERNHFTHLLQEMKKEVIYSHDILRGKIKYRPVMVESQKKKFVNNNKQKEQMKILIIFETTFQKLWWFGLLTIAKGL